MRIAIITAMAEETLPMYQKLGNIVAEKTIGGTVIRQIELEKHTLYLATCGIGEIRAALAVQLLVDVYNVEIVLNFGFVGALNPELNIGDLVVGKKVCHHQFDLSAINGTKVGQYDRRSEVFFALDKTLIEKICSQIETQSEYGETAPSIRSVATDAPSIHSHATNNTTKFNKKELSNKEVATNALHHFVETDTYVNSAPTSATQKTETDSFNDDATTKDTEAQTVTINTCDKTRTTNAPLRFVIIASGDKFVATKQDKQFLRKEFDADVCEMEMAGIALACERNNLPVFSLKVVSDKADESASESFSEVLAKGITKYEAVLPQILKALEENR